MLIETKNLTKIYTTGETEVRALDDVSLSISRGEFVSVVGFDQHETASFLGYFHSTETILLKCDEILQF